MNSRQKGARGEREAAKALNDALGTVMHRGRQYHGGQDAPDLKGDLEGIHFEVKRTEKFNLFKALEQAKGDAENDIPVVMHRKNGQPWMICVELDRLTELVVLLRGRIGCRNCVYADGWDCTIKVCAFKPKENNDQS